MVVTCRLTSQQHDSISQGHREIVVSGAYCLLKIASNMIVYVRDTETQRNDYLSVVFIAFLKSQQHVSHSQRRICLDNLQAAILGQKMQIKLAISPSHCNLMPGQQVLTLALQCQVPGRVATGVPQFNSLHTHVDIVIGLRACRPQHVVSLNECHYF